MKKHDFRRILSAAMACTVILGSVLSPAQNSFPYTQIAVAEETASGCSFDAETGVLTLSGEFSKEAVQAYSKNTAVKTVVTAEEGAVFPADCSNLFFSFCAETMDLSHADTSRVITMYNMFAHCSNLTSLDLSSFDTSNVTNMYGMFEHCWKLKSLNVTSFDTSRVTTMHGLFASCGSLESLDISNFNTSCVTSMAGMFNGCGSLESIDVSSFDTSGVVNFGVMFSGCARLTELDLSTFNTSKARYMSGMFSACYDLTDLDLSSFDTSNVREMGTMFRFCYSLKELNLASFNTAVTRDIDDMFTDCTELETIYVSDQWTTANIRTYGGDNLFNGCQALVGGNGTKYDPEHIDYKFAHIDSTSSPGYLTKGTPGRGGSWDGTKQHYYGIFEKPAAEADTEKQARPAMQQELNASEPETAVSEDSPAETNSFLPGDLNCDGNLSISDAVLLCRCVAEDSTLQISEAGLANADLDADSCITTMDITMMLRLLDERAAEGAPAYFILLGEYNEETQAVDLNWMCSEKTERVDILQSTDGAEYLILESFTDADAWSVPVSSLSGSVSFKAAYTTENQQTVESNIVQITLSDTGAAVTFPDSDGDGVEDVMESITGSDPQKTDTDGDGLTDFQEIYQTGTDPTKYGSVQSGKPDSAADSDFDGITNADELLMETNPLNHDTDGDGLYDGTEVNQYQTNPLLPDTDGDGLPDNFEIRYSLNPLSETTDEQNDADRIITQQISPISFVLQELNTADSPYSISAVAQVSGVADQEIAFENSGYTTALQNDALIGGVFDITIEDYCKTESIRVNLFVKEPYRSNTLNIYPEHGLFEGIKRLCLFRFYPEIGTLLPLVTQYDTLTNKVSADLTDGGTYCLMDMEIWLDMLNISPEDIEETESVTEPTAAEEQVEHRPKSLFAKSVPIDVVFVLQTAGPEYGKEIFEQQIQAIRSNCRKLFIDYTNVRVSVIEYQGWRSKLLKFNGRNYCTNITALTRELNKLTYDSYSSAVSWCNTESAFKVIGSELELREHTNAFIYHLVNGSNRYTVDCDGIALSQSDTAIFSQILPESYVWKDTAKSADLHDAILKNNGLEITLKALSTTMLYDHIEKNLDPFVDDSEFNVPCGAGFVKMTLKKAVFQPNDSDVDGDGIRDFEEIMNQYVHYDADGNLVIPTILDLMNDPHFDDQANNLLRHYTQSKDGRMIALGNKICKQPLIPFFSDPTIPDSDGDGLPDNSDNQPLSGFNSRYIIVDSLRYEPQIDFMNPNKLGTGYTEFDPKYGTVGKDGREKCYGRREPTLEDNAHHALLMLMATACRIPIITKGGGFVNSGELRDSYQAARYLQWFLKCKGPMTVTTDEMIEIVTTEPRNLFHYMQSVNRMMELGEETLRTGDTICFATGNLGTKVCCYAEKHCEWFHRIRINPGESVTDCTQFKSEASYDWAYAIGESFGSTVCEIARDGDTYSMTYRYILSDYYEWGYHIDGGDKEQHMLHECGLAKEYPVYGSVINTISWKKGERLDLYDQVLKQMQKSQDDSVQ
ncbi:MAG: BspA family leucine-rich repeat surface protein [Oscillospiraceae bacterium]|nr:BspA family leucine-rich repeat surface protein [Oscillospiraceae bacterium]